MRTLEQWARQPKKLLVAVGDLDRHIRCDTWFLGPTPVSPQTAFRSIRPFCTSHPPVCPTNRQTHRRTDTLRVTSAAMRAMRPNNINNCDDDGYTCVLCSATFLYV